MWLQSWVVAAPDAASASDSVKAALQHWAPADLPMPTIGEIRIYRGPDDTALGDAIAEDLADIQATVRQSHRQELSRRLRGLTQRPIGIPPKEGWVVLDDATPRSPRPLDIRGGKGPRWVVQVQWPGDLPTPPDPS